MIGTIFRKELLELLSSWRFAIFAAMLLLLGLVVVAARSVDHEKTLRDYTEVESLQSEMLDGSLYVGNAGGMLYHVYRRPARMSPIAQGLQQDLMDRLVLPVYEDPISVLYPPVDLLIVMGIVVSLGALLLSSDLICGERETGTIRLMTANAVKRSSILLGKWLACLAALGVGILLLFIVVALTLTLMRPDAWTGTDWGAFGILFFFSLVYASAFLMVGMFLSGVTRHTGTAAVLALMVWTATVFVLPSLPVYLAREVHPTESPTYLSIKKQREVIELRQARRKLREPFRARGLSEAEVDRLVDKKAESKLLEEFMEKRRAESASQKESLIQAAISAVVAHTSPFAAYVIGGTEISGVGVASMWSYQRFSEGQGQAMTEYLKIKEREWKEAKKNNPKLSPILDLRDRPRGVYRGDPFVFRLAGAGLPFLSLLMFNVLFFVLAWRRFLRYDVR